MVTGLVKNHGVMNSTPRNNFGKVSCSYVSLSPISIIWYRWEVSGKSRTLGSSIIVGSRTHEKIMKAFSKTTSEILDLY